MKTNQSNLDLIQVASPCPAVWDEMVGDERVRFCRQCKLHVYNLSEMSREEAEALVRQSTAGQASGATRLASSGSARTCVRFYRRADGTVLTRDCPVGLRLLRQRLVRSAAALAGVLVALVSGTLFGGMISKRMPSDLRTPSRAFADWINPERHILMGEMAMPGPPVMGGACAPLALPTLQAPDNPPARLCETPPLAPAIPLEPTEQRLEW
jgi:hypothetical protein